MSTKSAKSTDNTIALNKKGRHDYALEKDFEAGIVLQGWELKSIRAGKVQLVDSYVLLKDGEVWLLGVQIEPLQTASTHVDPDPRRTRKLLLHDREIAQLLKATSQKGYTCICTAMYWKGHLVKCKIALGKGKAQHDKREAQKQKDWQLDKQRLLRSGHKGRG